MNKRMKTLGRLLAAVTSLAMLLSMTAFAEEAKSTPEPTPTPSMEPAETLPPTPPSDDKGVKAVTPHLMAYAVTNAAGGEVTKVEKGDRVNIVLTIVDSQVPDDLKASQIAARVNSAAFIYTGLGEASNVDTGADTSTTAATTISPWTFLILATAWPRAA